jgi:hypothetical protein
MGIVLGEQSCTSSLGCRQEPLGGHLGQTPGQFSFFLILFIFLFYYIIVVLGYIVTFTKVLTKYHS